MNKFGILRLIFLGLGAAASLVVSFIEGKQMKEDIANEVSEQLKASNEVKKIGFNNEDN